MQQTMKVEEKPVSEWRKELHQTPCHHRLKVVQEAINEHQE